MNMPSESAMDTRFVRHNGGDHPKEIDDRYINQKEFRVMGMSRSGNHAIINWILRQAAGRNCFLNCAEGKTNPFVSAREADNGLPYEANYAEFEWEREQSGLLTQKNLLIHSYEDSFLGYVCHPLFEQNHDQWVGASKARYDLLILRDPFNLFASRLYADLSALSLSTAVRIWKQHANEFLGLRRTMNQQRILINYNRWATERSYRAQLAAQLGLHFTDAGISTVHRTAGGSSFDGYRYDGDASKMRVLDRWKVYQHDPHFRQLFDRDMVNTARRIFGPLASVEGLFEKTTATAA